jgi:hypothetical protein
MNLRVFCIAMELYLFAKRIENEQRFQHLGTEITML